jgi:acyl transferase domain-containing protein
MAAELTQLLKAVGGLWQSGIAIDRKVFFEREDRRRISLPTYAFERVRHWVNPWGNWPPALRMPVR